MTQATAPVAESLDFDLEYDGPALVAHEMDVRDLAPALLNAAEMFRTVNRLIRPADPDVQINIRASREGSFLVELKLLYDHAVAVLTTPALEGVEGLTGLLAVVVGVIRFKIKRGESGSHESETRVDGMIRLLWPDGTVLEIPEESPRLADDPSVARPLSAMVQPVERPGIDVLRIRRQGATVAEVREEHVASFRVGVKADREILSDTERETYLTIRSITWDEGRKWRFSDGLSTFHASISDPEFVALIEAREPFAKGDELKCVLRTVQWRDATGIHTEAEIVRVLEHTPPPPSPPELFGSG
jgi:hypothetical protein